MSEPEYSDEAGGSDGSPKKPKAPLELGNNAAVILEARNLAEAGKGKVRGEAKIWHMNDEHFAQVVEWMLAGVPAKRIEELCAKELKLPPAKVPGRQCQSIFWQEFRPSWYSARRQSNRRLVQGLAEEIDASPMKVDAVLRDEIKQRAWELLQSPVMPEKLVKAFLNAVLKLRDQDDRAEARTLDREKFAATQRTKIEDGLEALRSEIAENPEAMAAWQRLKTLLVVPA